MARWWAIRQWSAGRAMRALAYIALAALACAYILQFAFGFAPCELCLWERGPYAALAVLGLLGSLMAKTDSLRRFFMLAMLLSLLGLDGLVIFHIGVEESWWQGLSGCTASAGDSSSLDAMRAAILEAPLVSCNQPTAVFFGLSLAAWNGVLALGLTVLAWCMLSRYWRFYEPPRKTYW